MAQPDPALIEALIAKLRELPKVGEARERHESWMTAEQISRWWGGIQGAAPDAATIDGMLRDWWSTDPASAQIRPAKYPDRNTPSRLWGHVECVGRVPLHELRLFRTDEAIQLERIPLEEDAPLCFLSYAAPDMHLAARVRLMLGMRGVRAWMYAGQIQKGELVFESVRAALVASRSVIALVTAHSMPSAWLDSETHAAGGMVKPVAFAFDAADPLVMRVLTGWHPPRRHDDVLIQPKLLAELKAEYARYNDADRVSKYEQSAKELLFTMGVHQVCIYPRRPAGWTGDPTVADFEAWTPVP